MAYKMKDKETLMNISEVNYYGTKYTKPVKSQTSKGVLLGKIAKRKGKCSASFQIDLHRQKGEIGKEKKKTERKPNTFPSRQKK